MLFVIRRVAVYFHRMIFRPGNFRRNTHKDEAKGPSSAAINAGSAGAMEPANTTATAEEVAEEARHDVDCPADINTPAPPTGAPVDDVVGVRPGLTWEEAANVVMCTNDLMVVQADTTHRRPEIARPDQPLLVLRSPRAVDHGDFAAI